MNIIISLCLKYDGENKICKSYLTQVPTRYTYIDVHRNLMLVISTGSTHKTKDPFVPLKT